MTELYLKNLLIISKLVKLQTFIIITITILIIIILSHNHKKIKKFVGLLYAVYFLGIFLFFFPINKYGTDIITFHFIKRKLTPKSFTQFKRDMLSKKIEEKIISSYYLSKDIKYQIKKLDKEINFAEKEFEKIKGVEKKFIPWIDTSNRL